MLFPQGGEEAPVGCAAILLQFYHDGIFAGHPGVRKTFAKIASNFWRPGMREGVFKYVQGCELYQHAKKAENTRVGSHSSEP